MAEEPLEFEQEFHLQGAKANDMNRFQADEIMRWLQEYPEHMTDAMMAFDKTLMDVNEKISPGQDLLSGRIFDALTTGKISKERGW
eukprot:2533009-Heterocapsa_arctica.AAC.1